MQNMLAQYFPILSKRCSLVCKLTSSDTNGPNGIVAPELKISSFLPAAGKVYYRFVVYIVNLIKYSALPKAMALSLALEFKNLNCTHAKNCVL